MTTAVLPADLSARELIRETTRDVRALARLELALAKDDLFRELAAVKTAAAFAAGAVLLLQLAGAALLVAVGLTFGVACTLAVAGALLTTAVVLGACAYRTLPRHIMSATVDRLQLDEALVKAHLP